MQRATLAILLTGLSALPIRAETRSSQPAPLPTLGEVLVTATRIPMPDVAAPYASEVHTRTMLQASGATSLMDYLSRHTSLHVMPSYGNRFTPKLDMRGYGIGDGYQNIAISLDGRRLNNLDMVPQAIGAIPLEDIERIEITKGSGSVLFGDGATAGAIQIMRRKRDGASVAVAGGNRGQRTGSLAAGLHRPRVSLQASIDAQADEGHSAMDPTGHRDESRQHGWHGELEARPVRGVALGIEGGRDHIDTRYVNYLSQAQFLANPGQLGSNLYTSPVNAYNRLRLDSDTWRLRGDFALPHGWRLRASHGREDRLMNYNPFWRPDYEYVGSDLSLGHSGERLDLLLGAQRFEGRRHSGTDHTRKRNSAWYVQGLYRLRDTTLSAGIRREDVDYGYTPLAGAGSQAGHDLTAWDVGINRQVHDRLSLFANLNRAFQAPDVDRFFTFGGGFNGFIRPALSRTLNLGLNHATPVNRLKLSVYRAELSHEIYYLDTGNWLTSYNTNLDKTHKYGLELQDTWQATPDLGLGLNYAYTRARIDREADAGGAYDGKDLPGVPRHGLSLNADYRLGAATWLQLAHTWRSKAWAATDFDNDNAQRQKPYQSTSLVLRHQWQGMEWFLAVDNLFQRRNGLWVADDVIYPYHFRRDWRAGLKASF
ncbi:MAG TPA: TonB-dependent receptor [Thiobacillaceae bacterium]|nr:TonB-dependent receptor [Thiobacillaceae bacterium]HNU64359.1 TonB-dependent receptor [Thiobacillaceae bacterium]